MDASLKNYAENIDKLHSELNAQKKEVQELIRHINNTSINDIKDTLEQIDDKLYFILQNVSETQDKYNELVEYAESLEPNDNN